MNSLKKGLTLFVALCVALSAMCSVAAFAAEESYMEVIYSRDFTKLTADDGAFTAQGGIDGINYKIDDLEAASIYRASGTSYPVTVDENGIGTTKGYFCYNKELSNNYIISGTFNLANMAGQNDVTFYINRTYNASSVGANYINAPVGADGFHVNVKSTSKTEDGATVLGLVVKMYRGSTSDATKIFEETVYPGVRIACGEDVDFCITYNSGIFGIDFKKADGTQIYNKSDVDLKSWCETNSAELKNSGVFAIKENNGIADTAANYFMLKNLTVKEEYTTGDKTLFEENFNALAAAGTTYETYDIDSLGWSTYTAKGNSAVSSSYKTGQLELFKGTTPCGLTTSGAGIGVYNTELENSYNASAYALHYLTTFTKIWFNSEFDGTTNESGFYFAFDKTGAQMTFVYVDGNARWVLDTDSTANLAFLGDKGTATYDLSYENGVVNIKVYNSSNTAVIDKTYTLSEICDEIGVGEYNTKGKYAIEFAGGGFMDIRNVSITAPVSDVALSEKITDGDTVSASVVYQSPYQVPVKVIAAAYDVTGALIAVQVKDGLESIDEVDFNMEKKIDAEAKTVKVFLIDSLEVLTPMCKALEVEIH